MVKIFGAVKCFNCGHISGHLSAEKVSDGREVRRFTPRPGYQGTLPRAGETLRCERCRGPVFLDESERVLSYEMPIELRPEAAGLGRKAVKKAS